MPRGSKYRHGASTTNRFGVQEIEVNGQRKVSITWQTMVETWGVEGKVPEDKLRELMRYEVQTDSQLELVIAAVKRGVFSGFVEWKPGTGRRRA